MKLFGYIELETLRIKDHLHKKHDTIYIYSKNNNFIFNIIKENWVRIKSWQKDKIYSR